ncbi:c-type cytochrome [Dichotomicrobium thermohalophilum]|uniref:Cytochrome c n=1 Tax=Dichotomicrobium thermohalophilum TaxID=933063 RepID=A0A397PH34_9HYPH|nr:c-type cytochrome [Dichotomicrobium thermohalophilum]RIA47189.1 cytochrome c [Dichotomicrobium thermohalophilum]
MRALAFKASRWLSGILVAAVVPLGLATAAAQDKPDASGTRNLVGHGGPVRGLAIADDGRHALTASFDYAAMYWDLGAKPPKAVQRLIGHDGPVNEAVFVPGGQALTGSDDGTLALWDLDTGEIVHRFEGHDAKVVDVAVSPDGERAASASWDRTVRLWRIADGKLIAELKGHTGPVNAVGFSENGEHLYSGSYDGSIRLWHADGSEATAIRPVVEYGWGINAMRLLPGARIAFGAQNGDVRVIDRDGNEIKVLAPHEGPVLSLAVSPERDVLATGGADGMIRLWQTDDWAVGETYSNPTGPVWALAFKSAGELYYGGLDDFAIYWRANPREPFEPVPSKYPRRFQVSGEMSLGERQFARKCSVCHTLTPADGNRAGPTLYGIFGRKAGALPDYPYSEGLKDADIVWNEETIGELFDKGPDHVTPGSKMPLQVITDEKKLEALVAFLKKATRKTEDAERPAERQ